KYETQDAGDEKARHQNSERFDKAVEKGMARINDLLPERNEHFRDSCKEHWVGQMTADFPKRQEARECHGHDHEAIDLGSTDTGAHSQQGCIVGGRHGSAPSSVASRIHRLRISQAWDLISPKRGSARTLLVRGRGRSMLISSAMRPGRAAMTTTRLAT